MMKRWIDMVLFLLMVVLGSGSASGQQETHAISAYVPETDPQVLEKLEDWQDLKFGLMMHWGTYSQWAIVESWSLCPEEHPWCRRVAGTHPDDYTKYRFEYENMFRAFNPVKFDPQRWAQTARKAGMKYVVFTTKHCDGFCMYDSKYTNYKITNPDCPFSEHPKKNVAKEIFDEFRKEGLWAGVYFSKPDWNSPLYWDPRYPPRDRNVNYNPAENPETWQQFVDFTHNQIMELLTDYGNIDILWLDGGWVSKKTKEEIVEWTAQQLRNSPDGYLKTRMVNQDIQMDALVEKAREVQPGLIVVDRSVHGKNQNYLTPENYVPKVPLHAPWESVIPSSNGGWTHGVGVHYISDFQGVQLLVDVVANGGNLLLNVAPTPDGEWEEGAYSLLEGMGAWLEINGEGIYGTRQLAPYQQDKFRMTQKGDGSAYFFYKKDYPETNIPKEWVIESHQPAAGATLTLLGAEDQPLEWELRDEGFAVKFPKRLRTNPPCDHVWTLKVSELRK